MIEINLVPDIKQELIRAQRIRATVIMFSIIIGIVSVAVVSLLASYVFIAQNIRSNIADDSIKSENSKLMGVEDVSKTVTIQNQLSKITELNSSKMISSRIFNMLVAIIPPSPNDIKISNLTIDSGTGKVTMEAQASNGYTALEVFKKTIERTRIEYTEVDDVELSSDIATNISIKDVSYGSDSSGAKVLRFSLEFNYSKEFFSPATKNISIVIVDGGNVTDSYLGFPKSIFTTPAVDITEEL